MKLSLAFSPCPNDTFIFDALVNQKIDTEGLEFELHLDDVENLNHAAFDQKYDITKLSYHAFMFLTDHYNLLDAGSALGFGVGPLLIANKEMLLSDCINASIAIPGKFTTANMLLSLALPGAKNKTEVLFSEIEQAVTEGKFDCGLIIHESRFTYMDKGLKKIADLGEFWEEKTHSAIPLGGIVIRKNIPPDIQQKMNQLIRRSVEYAFENNKETLPEFIRCNAQEMSEAVIRKHIALYVNKYSLSLAGEGIKAINALFKTAFDNKLIDRIPHNFLICSP
jgi:1,4-dihydroxy-6-naphthoate synthase